MSDCKGCLEYQGSIKGQSLHLGG